MNRALSSKDRDAWNLRETISGKEIHRLITISDAINWFKSSLKNRIRDEVCVVKIAHLSPFGLAFWPEF